MNRTTAIIIALSVALLATIGLLIQGRMRSSSSVATNNSAVGVNTTGGGSASISGDIGVPEGVEAFGVTVFAEGTSFMALTDADGRFTVSGLKEGTYKFRATRPDLESAELESVTVTRDDMAKSQPFRELLRVLMDVRGGGDDATDIMLASLGAVRGHVATTTSGDQSGTTVLIEGTRHRTVTTASGDFEIINIEPGTYSIVFFRSGFAQSKAQITISAGQTTNVADVALASREDSTEGDRSITGRVEVLTADGSPLRDLSMVRVSVEGTSYSATPDASGRFEIGNLPPRVIIVSATAPGYLLEKKVSADLQSFASQSIDLTLLEDTITASAKGIIIGRVFLAKSKTGQGGGGVSVSVAGTSRIAFTNAAGSYRIDSVDAGIHDIVASFNGYKTATIQGLDVAAAGETSAPDLTLEEDVEAPTVVSTSPTDRQTNVTIQQPTTAVIQFSMNMNSGSVIDAITVSPKVAFRVRSEGGQDVYALDMDAAPRDGQVPLKYGLKYTVSIASSAMSVGGVPMAEDFEFSFTTGFAEVIGASARDGDTGIVVNFDRPLAIYFNAPIDTDSISADDITFSPSFPSKPNLNFRKDPNTGWSTVFVSGFAQQNTTYVMTVRRGVKTITGDRVRNTPYRVKFTTAEWRDLGELYNVGSDSSRESRRERNRRR